MKAQRCDICQSLKMQNQNGHVTIQYQNPELGTSKEAQVCWECQDKSLKQLLHETVMQ